MEKLIYKWKNFGEMRLGYDLAQLEIEVNTKQIKIVINSGAVLIEDCLFYKKSKILPKQLISELEEIKFPEKRQYENEGCDGWAWELIVDDVNYVGYLSEPEFLKSVLKIIKFDEIYKYANQKLREFTN